MFTKEPDATTSATPDEKARPHFLKLDRRGFLTGGLAMGVVLTGCAQTQAVVEELPQVELLPEKLGGNPLKDVKGGDANPELWIEITTDSAVKVTCHRAEMGQQVWTAMAQIVADELEANWDDVEIVQAIGHPKYGDQNTDGSRSVRFNFHRLRVAGAAMRMMLVHAAAKRWGVNPAQVTSENGVVLLRGEKKQTLTYAELAEEAALLEPPTEDMLVLKTRDQWKLIGKKIHSLTVPKIVKGEGQFGIDVDLPDMVYAVIARPPQVFGKTGDYNDAETLKIPGVLKTVKLPDPTPPILFKPLGGVAVVAKDTWAAIQGREALEVQWIDGPNAGYDSEQYAQDLIASSKADGKVQRNRGDVVAALDSASKTVSADYYAAHLSQSPMEPPVATARWTGDKLEVWACTQDAQSARTMLAGALKIAPDNITVTPTWLGGAFGRKSKPDFIIEAAMVAKEVGKPVKLQWTREDEVRHGFYHSVSAQHFEAGLDEAGNCTAWLHRAAYPSISALFNPFSDGPAANELSLGAIDVPFATPNLRVESGKAKAHVRIGWLRSVANVYQAFAIQSFAAELAEAAGRDPKDYLLELIGPARTVDPGAEGASYLNYNATLEEYPIETERLSNVTKAVAEMAGWGRELPKGKGLGIAAHRSFLTYVATVVEVDVSEDGKVRIPKVWVAADAGTVVNLRHTIDQMEGGTVFGLSNALYGSITAKNGAIVQSNFPEWRLMRMDEAPMDVEVKIVESNAPPGGVGEPGTPPAAPALANAIFAATGKRFRNLPLIGANNDTLDLA